MLAALVVDLLIQYTPLLFLIHRLLVPIHLVHNQPAYPTIWHSYARAMSFRVPRLWQKLLHDKGSLTQRLIQASQGDFAVRVVRNCPGIPNQSEVQALGLLPRQKAIIREVELLCHGQVWVCARSIIPFSTLEGPLRIYKDIGNKPLGALLFKHHNMHRGPLQVACLKRVDSPLQHWARRSVFHLDSKGILVTEVFMPPMEAVARAG